MTQDQNPTTEPDEPQNPATEPDSGTQDDPDSFPREYVEKLRREAADHRKKAEQVDTLRDALQAAYLRLGTQGILHDPEALPWSDEFQNPETGLPDTERIREAAEELAETKPYLSRPRGDVGQGFRGTESDAVDLAGMLKAGA